MSAIADHTALDWRPLASRLQDQGKRIMTERVLIAESNPALRTIGQECFSRNGFEVATASNGLDCLDKLQHASFAALVLEQELVGGGGDSVLSHVHTDFMPYAPSVVFLYGHDFAKWPDDLPEKPIVWRFIKPIRFSALLWCLRFVCDGVGNGHGDLRRHISDLTLGSFGPVEIF